MNNSNTKPQPLGILPMPKKHFPVGFIILIAVGLLVVLAILGGIYAFKAVGQGSSQATVVGNKFIDSMGQHNFQAAQALFLPQLQARMPAGNLKDIQTLIEKHHGAYVNHSAPEWNVQSLNGQTSVRLIYFMKFTKSNSMITMTLLKTDKGYQVNDIHYNDL